MIPEGFEVVCYCNDLLDRSLEFVIGALTTRLCSCSTHTNLRFWNNTSPQGESVQLMVIGKKKP